MKKMPAGRSSIFTGMGAMQKILTEISACAICKVHLPLGPRPVLQAGTEARIVIIGQAPGSKVHKTGIPWDDASGSQLRKWLGVDKDIFYDPGIIALIPMGFCYPGKGSSGDMPPRPECAPQWHGQLLDSMNKVQLTILVGQYAQQYYLGKKAGRNLTETVKAYKEYLPEYLPLPHPSPRNRFWLSKNPWFADEVLPVLQEKVNGLTR